MPPEAFALAAKRLLTLVRASRSSCVFKIPRRDCSTYISRSASSLLHSSQYTKGKLDTGPVIRVLQCVQVIFMFVFS